MGWGFWRGGFWLGLSRFASSKGRGRCCVGPSLANSQKVLTTAVGPDGGGKIGANRLHAMARECPGSNTTEYQLGLWHPMAICSLQRQGVRVQRRDGDCGCQSWFQKASARLGRVWAERTFGAISGALRQTVPARDLALRPHACVRSSVRSTDYGVLRSVIRTVRSS